MVDRQVRRWWWTIAVLEVAAIAIQLAMQWDSASVFFRGFVHGTVALALLHAWLRWRRIWHRPPLGPPP